MSSAHKVITKFLPLSLFGAGLIALTVSASAIAAPFGETTDTADAASLWATLEKAQLVGNNAIMSVPYEGMEPHGAILETLEKSIFALGHSGHVIVKRNYGGKGITKDAVVEDPAKWLKAITVMYNRGHDYDSDNKNWFWVKYSPDGSLQKNPKGMALAGRVAKGMDKGCIACHQAAPGGDYVFNHDRIKKFDH